MLQASVLVPTWLEFCHRRGLAVPWKLLRKGGVLGSYRATMLTWNLDPV